MASANGFSPGFQPLSFVHISGDRRIVALCASFFAVPAVLCFDKRKLTFFWPPLTLRSLPIEATLWYKKTVNLNSIFSHVLTHERHSISPSGPGNSGVWPIKVGESRTDRHRK